jgi:cobyrinic acid a,c-diamide synthase
VSGNLLGIDSIVDAIGQAGIGADLVLVDGHGGLFDGVGLGDISGSDAEFIRATGTPAIAVIETPDLSTSIMARLHGLTKFGNQPPIQGCVLNGLRRDLAGSGALTPSEWEWLGNDFSRDDLPNCVGCVPVLELSGALPEQQSLEAVASAAVPLQLLTELREAVEAYLDIDAILAAAALATPLEYREYQPVAPFGHCRIAVANDSCFGLCFEDNLDLLRLSGAELVSISPLADTKLPENIGGVYLPGAFLSEYADTLERNGLFYDALRGFVEGGGALFAEGGGAAFLCDSFRPDGSERSFRGVGLIRREALGRPEFRSFWDVTLVDDCVLGSLGSSARALNGGGWASKPLSSGNGSAAEVSALRFSGSGDTEFFEGFSAFPNLLATFSFIHFGANPEMARSFCTAAAGHQGSLV